MRLSYSDENIKVYDDSNRNAGELIQKYFMNSFRTKNKAKTEHHY